MLPEPLFLNIHMYILYSARGYHKDRFLYDILCKIQSFVRFIYLNIKYAYIHASELSCIAI